MSALLALLIAVSGGDDDLAGQVERCGIARAAIKADDSEFPHIIVHAGDVTDAQLDCVAAIWMRLPRVNFSDAAVQARFLPRFDRALQRRAVSDSREWLAQQGLLDRLPRFDTARQSLAAFGLAIERYCGARPRSILRAHGRALDIREPDQRRNRIAVIQCVMMSALASDLPAFGYTLTAGGEAVSWTEING